MKILTFIFTAIVCFTAQNSFSQEEVIVKDSAYIADYNKLKSLHIKELTSDIHIEYSKKLKDFLDKINGKMPEIKNSPDDIINWVKDNMDKTNFMSFTEAEFEWGIINQLQAESIKQNQEYYNFMMVIMEKYGVDMIVEELMETETEYLDKF